MPEMTWGQMREQAATQGFEPLPPGPYNVQVSESSVVPGSTGQPQIKVRLKVLDGPLAARGILNRIVPFKKDGDVNGMFFQQLSALGFGKEHQIWAQMDQMEFGQSLEWLAPQLIGTQCMIEVTNEPYRGEMRDNVARMKPLGGAVPSTFGGQVPQMPVAVPQPGVPQPQAPAPAVSPAAPLQQPPPPVAPAPAPAPVAPAPAPVAPAPVAAAPAAVPEYGPGSEAPAPVAPVAPVAPAAPVPQPPAPLTETPGTQPDPF